MSTRRTLGGVSLGMIRKGKDGRPRCRWCKGPVERPRRTFCCAEHVHEWKIRRDPSYAREEVYERDQGRCAGCELDTVAEYHRLKLLERTDPEAYRRELEDRRIPANFKSLWQADHVLGVAEGGGECGLEGYQTLCCWCHRKKSGEAATARSKRR